MLLGYTKEKLEDKVAIKTASEIAHQPHMWEKTYEIVKNNQHIQALVDSFSNDVNATIIFAGAGSSEFVGNISKTIISQHVDCTVLSIPTTDIITNISDYINSKERTLMISFGRSGSSPESMGAVDVTNNYFDTVTHLAITCNKDGDLSNYAKNNENGYSIVLPDKTNDLGFAMTSSFTSMLLATILLFNKDLNSKDIFNLNDLTNLLINERALKIDEIVKGFDFDRIVYLGSGQNKEVGKEVNLKMLELTKGEVVGIYDSYLGFRHGPKSFLNKKTLLVTFMSNDEYINKYEVDLINEIINEKKHGELFIANPLGDIKLISSAIDYSNSVNESINNELLALYYIVVGQLLSFYKSIKHEVTTDNPFPEGNLNRVVHGVKMHY